MPTKNDPKDKPYVENYPPLKAWLDKHGAICQFQLPLGHKDRPVGYVEQYVLRGGRECIVVVHAQQHGWELYTAPNTNDVSKTLEDAEVRLELWPGPTSKPYTIQYLEPGTGWTSSKLGTIGVATHASRAEATTTIGKLKQLQAPWSDYEYRVLPEEHGADTPS